jgi:hypothetical protein
MPLMPAVELVRTIAPPLPRDHGRDRGLDGVEHAGQVHVDHVLPRAVNLVQRHGRDAGVGQDDVHRAEFGHACLERRLELRLVPHVGLPREDPAVQRLDLLDGLGQVLRSGHGVGNRLDLPADVNRDDVGALLRQPHRVASSLPARRPGDEGDFAFELSVTFRPFMLLCCCVVGLAQYRAWPAPTVIASAVRTRRHDGSPPQRIRPADSRRTPGRAAHPDGSAPPHRCRRAGGA